MFSYPSSMENVPSKINENQLIKMEIGNEKYYFHYRGTLKTFAKQAQHNLSPTTLLAKSLGLGFLANLDQTNRSYYYVTKNEPSGEPIQSTINGNILKMYIKLFAFEKGIYLDKAVFSVTGLSGFGFRSSLEAEIRYLKGL